MALRNDPSGKNNAKRRKQELAFTQWHSLEITFTLIYDLAAIQIVSSLLNLRRFRCNSLIYSAVLNFQLVFLVFVIHEIQVVQSADLHESYTMCVFARFARDKKCAKIIRI